jgi:hypothetical protein
MPLRRTYASANLTLDSLSESTENVQHTVQPPTVAPVLSPTTVLQPIINLPAPSSRRRFSRYLYRQSSLLSPRRLPPLRRSLHADRRIIPPFKPGQNLYRKVLNQQFLGATKKATINNQDPFFISLFRPSDSDNPAFQTGTISLPEGFEPTVFGCDQESYHQQSPKLGSFLRQPSSIVEESRSLAVSSDIKQNLSAVEANEVNVNILRVALE